VSAEGIRLQIDHVGKTYGSRRVLRQVSAELECGDTLLVTGRNGAGKTTLLRIIAGLLRPSEGAIHFWRDGVRYGEEQRRRAFGFVGPYIQLYRELTAREHIELVARLRSLPLQPGASAATLAEFGLAGREDEPIGSYSSGMIQRLRYALALLHRPDVLLLDEPTTNLDDAGVALVGWLVDETARRGIVVLASNDPRDVHFGELVLNLDGPADG
jgi:heme exporter protein A